MALDRLARKQTELKAKQQPRRGRQAKLPEPTAEDVRLMVALILLRQGWSVSLVSIHERVQLPVEQVQRCYDALKAGLTNG